MPPTGSFFPLSTHFFPSAFGNLVPADILKLNSLFLIQLHHLFLDRFSQFFIAPVFNENCKDREIRAIESEFKLRLNDDYRRLFQLSKSLCSPDHPYSRFGSGNLKTLEESPAKEGIDVRAELIAFYHKYYSANIMKLCIVGRGNVSFCACEGVVY